MFQKSLGDNGDVEAKLRSWLVGLEDGLEAEVIEAGLSGNLGDILVLLPRMFPTAGSLSICFRESFVSFISRNLNSEVSNQQYSI